jgi:hypothetical protein
MGMGNDAVIDDPVNRMAAAFRPLMQEAGVPLPEGQALGWTAEGWDKGGGYQGADDRERLWCSPHCLRPERDEDLFAGLMG